MQQQMKLALTPSHTEVTDKYLRKTLIKTAMTAERLLKLGPDQGGITMTTPLISTIPWGLRIDCHIEQTKEDKPLRFFFAYHVDPLEYKDWLDQHPYMTEAPFGFTSHGVEVLFPGDGSQNYDKSGFFINHRNDDEDVVGEKIPLNLLGEEGATFVVHRDIFSQEDWIVQLVS